MELKRTKIVIGRRRAAVNIAGDVGIETEVLGKIAIPAEVPLSNGRRLVSSLL